MENYDKIKLACRVLRSKKSSDHQMLKNVSVLQGLCAPNPDAVKQLCGHQWSTCF